MHGSDVRGGFSQTFLAGAAGAKVLVHFGGVLAGKGSHHDGFQLLVRDVLHRFSIHLFPIEIGSGCLARIRRLFRAGGEGSNRATASA